MDNTGIMSKKQSNGLSVLVLLQIFDIASTNVFMNEKKYLWLF